MRLQVTFWCFVATSWAGAAEVSTTEIARNLDRSAKACLQHFAPGGTATQEGFEACLKQSVDQYYRTLVTKAWGAPKAPLVADVSIPTPAPTPAIDRKKESAAVKEEFKQLVKSSKCQRCHIGMDPSQFTLEQMHSVLNTPSHREHLGPAEFNFLRRLGGQL